MGPRGSESKKGEEERALKKIVGMMITLSLICPWAQEEPKYLNDDNSAPMTPQDV
jgi:hypothetical protein